MKKHFSFDDKQYPALLKNGVVVADLFETVKLFDPYKTMATINKVGLFYYLDAKGDFNKRPSYPHRKIAKMFFENLNNDDKIEVFSYLEFLKKRK